VRHVLVEGIDRTGKSTLIDGLLNTLGFFEVVHYAKPKLLDILLKSESLLHPEATEIFWRSQALKNFQQRAFTNMFHMLSSEGNFILDRAHLGEAVYAKRYRGYNGDYVFDLEEHFEQSFGPKFREQSLLVLLHTSNFDFIKDDGLSFDFDKKEEEQMDFIKAFEKSNFKYKLMIDVNDSTGIFAPAQAILDAVTAAYQRPQDLPHSTWHISWRRNDSGLTRLDYFQPDPKRTVR